MKDIWLIVISFLYIFVIIGLAGILSKKYQFNWSFGQFALSSSLAY